MKKSLVVVTVLLAILAISISSCYAAAAYYKGDRNYPKVGMYHDQDIYVNRASVAVDEYNPPIYQIHGTVIYVDQRDGSISSHTEIFRYNYKKGTMYYQPYVGKWSQLTHSGYNAEHMMHMGVGLEFFETAYDMEFPLR